MGQYEASLITDLLYESEGCHETSILSSPMLYRRTITTDESKIQYKTNVVRTIFPTILTFQMKQNITQYHISVTIYIIQNKRKKETKGGKATVQ